jgi:hypothetical protein
MLRFMVFASTLVACSPDPCSNSTATNPVALDVSGASNLDCALSITDGTTTIDYDIPAPSPALADAPPDPTQAPTNCFPYAPPDGGAVFSGGTRTSTEICFQGDDALGALAHAKNVSMCPLQLTLTCNGTVLYDHATWHFCYENC